MAKLLLTGSNGFIGSYFKKHYSHIHQIATFSFLNESLDTLNLAETDVVVHLSALVHQMGGANKKEYEDVNITQTLKLAQKAKESGVKHFIFMSTVKVYGEESDTVYKEDTKCNPRDEYGESKLEAETKLQKLDDDSFTVSIVRTPIVYGEGVKANILNLINLIKKVPVLPFGNIQNRRSMVYVGNLCAIINRIIELRKPGIFLASDDRAFSTTEFVHLIALALNKKSFLVSVPFFQFLLKQIKPSLYNRLYKSLEVDNTFTKKVLGFSNPYSIEEGIKLMINEEMKSANK